MITSDEIHSFVIGFFEVLCPWKARYHTLDSCPGYLRSEYHYYLAGRGFGLPALLLILIALCKLAKEVL